jgi:threonine/homoserine/homoserine lactone efflux protein
MDITFWKGVFMGILIALPTGPVSFLIIRRIYLFGIRVGLYSTIGALITDIFYIAVVGFGLKTIQRFLGMTTGYAEIIAGIIIIVSGYRIMKEREQNIEQEIYQQNPLKNIISITLLNILNPTLVFSFSALFLTFGMGSSIGNPRDIGTFLIGFITGTMIFWYGFGLLIIRMKTRNQSHRMHIINKGFGVMLLVIGIILLLLAIIHIIFPGYIN